jgi:hypothetical protein
MRCFAQLSSGQEEVMNAQAVFLRVDNMQNLKLKLAMIVCVPQRHTCDMICFRAVAQPWHFFTTLMCDVILIGTIHNSGDPPQLALFQTCTLATILDDVAKETKNGQGE